MNGTMTERKRGVRAVAMAAALIASLASGAARGEAAAAVSASAAAPAPIPGIPGGPMLTPGENAEETYQLNYVGIQHFEFGGYQGANGLYVSKTERWEGFRGKYKLKLGVLEFYDAVARPDLHKKGTTHAIIAASFLIGGLALMGAGGYYTATHFEHGPPAIGLVGFGLGLVFVFAAKGMTFQPTTEAEAYKLARTYNDRLRARLGLPPIVEDPTKPEAARPWHKRIAVAGSVTPSGGGVLLMGTF